MAIYDFNLNDPGLMDYYTKVSTCKEAEITTEKILYDSKARVLKQTNEYVTPTTTSVAKVDLDLIQNFQFDGIFNKFSLKGTGT